MSGAVGAMCRQRRVDSAIERRVMGGGRYRNMSSSGWPECTRTTRSGVRDDEAFEVEAADLEEVVLPRAAASGGGDVEIRR